MVLCPIVDYTKDKISEIDHTSQLIRELAFLDDERDIYWYPSVVNMGKLGIIYPDGITLPIGFGIGSSQG